MDGLQICIFFSELKGRWSPKSHLNASKQRYLALTVGCFGNQIMEDDNVQNSVVSLNVRKNVDKRTRSVSPFLFISTIMYIITIDGRKLICVDQNT